MILIALIALVMVFVLTARFLKILDRAVDWLYFRFPDPSAGVQESEPEEDKEPDIKLPSLKASKKKVS